MIRALSRHRRHGAGSPSPPPQERLSEPLEPPTLADRRRPVLESYVESREDFLQEESNTKRERNAVLDKAQASGDALGVAVNATDSLPNALEA